MNASSYIGYGIIGTSDGFVAQTAGVIAGFDIGAIVDMDNRQLFAPFGTEIIAGIREKRGDHMYTYFVLYRYALEQERSRKGSFYGSVVALKDCTADGFAVYNLLLELATNVKLYLDPETSRFLAPIEEISFLRPNSLEEVINTVKKLNVQQYHQAAYFAPLPNFSRNSFRFIDFFQSDTNAVERIFASDDSEVLELVKNKKGIAIKKLQLEDSNVEKKLEQLENIDTEVFIREKELENIHFQLNEIRQQQEQLGQDKNNLAQKVSQLEELVQSKQVALKDFDQMENQKSELENLINSLSQRKSELEAEIERLKNHAKKAKNKIKQKEALNKKMVVEEGRAKFNASNSFKEKKNPSGKQTFQRFMSTLHPVVRLSVLVFVFLGLGTIGYLTTTAFGKNRLAAKKENITIIPSKEILRLEKEIHQKYLAFDKLTQDSYLSRLSPFLSDQDTIVQQKAIQIQQYILSIGYDYYTKELKRTDTIPVLHNQLVEEFEVLKKEYGALTMDGN